MMASLKTSAIAVLTATSIGSAALATPAFAEQRKVGVDAIRLDKAPAEYSQYYRRGWHGGGYSRGAAVAAGIGVGVLGAAAVAASRRAYADPYYYNDGYYAAPGYDYGYAPVYADAPVYAPSYGGYDYGYGSATSFPTISGIRPEAAIAEASVAGK